MLKTNYNIEKYLVKHGNKYLPEQLNKRKENTKILHK